MRLFTRVRDYYRDWKYNEVQEAIAMDALEALNLRRELRYAALNNVQMGSVLLCATTISVVIMTTMPLPLVAVVPLLTITCAAGGGVVMSVLGYIYCELRLRSLRQGQRLKKWGAAPPGGWLDQTLLDQQEEAQRAMEAAQREAEQAMEAAEMEGALRGGNPAEVVAAQRRYWENVRSTEEARRQAQQPQDPRSAPD